MCVVLLSQPSTRDLLDVKRLCVLSCYLSPVVEICYVKRLCQPSVVLLSQPSSRDLLYVKLEICLFVLLSQPSSRDLLYVKRLCVLSCYLSPVVEICYMLNVCVCCLVISAQ